MTDARVAILGIFVADLIFRAAALPKIGETILGSGFSIGPGGKASNQSVAAARAGANVSFITRIGDDTFGNIGRAMWKENGIDARLLPADGSATGAAFIYVSDKTGDNAIIVVPGAARSTTAADVEREAGAIRAARVFMTQLEAPVEAGRRGLEIAKAAGVTTIFNPAPAEAFDDAIYPLCDYITPNESEAAALTGVPVVSVEDARRAADVLLGKGAKAALITLGDKGALLHTRAESILVPVFNAGPVIDTTGAGDGFNGAFAAALASGRTPADAARFASAAAGISVTRFGTAPSMPMRDEIEALLKR